MLRYMTESKLAQAMAFAWRHQDITWTNAGLASQVFCGTHLRTMSQEAPMKLIRNMCLDITS